MDKAEMEKALEKLFNQIAEASKTIDRITIAITIKPDKLIKSEAPRKQK